MGFQQLYYTSCAQGLAGYAGYQFNAASPGVTPDAMREVERLTVYELPNSVAPDQLDNHPVNLCYTPDAAGRPVVARAVSVGSDPSGRPGNYFAHALVADSVDELAGMLPVQLWEAPFWRERAVDDTHLPELSAPLSNGPIGRERVAEWTRSRAMDFLARLLTAVDRAIDGDRPVVLVGASTEVARTIAAVSYLLAPVRTRRMSFATYSRHPDYTPVHVIGVLPETGRELDPHGRFAVFDLDSGADGGIEPHPLAVRLTALGVEFGQTLWEEAGGLAVGTEDSLVDWYPIVLASVVLHLGEERLSTEELAVLTRWVPKAAGRIPPANVASLLTFIMETSEVPLDDAVLAGLHSAARRLGTPEALEGIEEALALRALDGVVAGRAPASGITIASERVRRTVAERAVMLLREDAARANPSVGAELLSWLRASGVVVADDAVESYGRDVVAPLLLADPAAPDPQAARITQLYPAIQRGVASRIAERSAEKAEALLDGPVGALLAEAALLPYPRLGEIRAVLAAQRSSDRVGALFEIIRARRERRTRGHYKGRDLDFALLSSIWRGEHGPADALALLHRLRSAVDVAPDVGDWLQEAVVTPPDPGENRAWQELVGRLATDPRGQLLPPQGWEVVTGFGTYTRFRQGIKHDTSAGWAQRLPELHAALDRTPPAVRISVHHDLRAMIVESMTSDGLPKTLSECPHDLFDQICDEVARRTSCRPPDLGTAQRFYTVTRSPRLSRNSPERAERLLGDVLAGAVRSWNRRDIADFRARLPVGEEEGFDAWRNETKQSVSERTGGLLNRIVGRGSDRRR